MQFYHQDFIEERKQINDLKNHSNLKELAINKIVNNIVLYFLIPNWSIQTGI